MIARPVARSPVVRRSTCATRATLAVALACLIGAHPAHAQARYVQTNLVSSIPGLATTYDPMLINPWGISFSATSPFWVSNNGSGNTTLYNGAGAKQNLVVTIPGPSMGTQSEPTGQVFNNAGTFQLGNGSNATFLFATEGGTIAGWNGAAGTTALTAAFGAQGSAYTGIAIGGSGSSARLYAANFGLGQIDVWDGGFTLQSGTGFVDPNLPGGYSPFNVQNLGGHLFVTYAQKDPATGDEMKGVGLGIVDEYDLSGALVRRFVSNGGALDAPWGLAIAPSGFGSFGGDLLVGNFGDGTIHAYDLFTGALDGVLLGTNGNPLVNDGLWGITFGNGANGGSPNALYFAAGLDDETQGLFGRVTATPEPASLVLLATGIVGLALMRRRRA